MAINLIDKLNDQQRLILDNVKSNANPFLEMIKSSFPQYTDHGIKHSESIIKIIENLLIDDYSLKELIKDSTWPILFILLSAYLHDIGMVDFPEISTANGTRLTSDEIRNTHNIRSNIIVQSKWNILGLGDEFQAEIIGKICQNHSGVIKDEFLTYTEDIPYDKFHINVGYCSAIIRLADELDMLLNRVSYLQNEFITNEKSKLEWSTHFAIGACTSHHLFKHYILIKCKCNSLVVHRNLKHKESKINSLLASLNKYLEPSLPYNACIMDIETKGYVDKDIKFSIAESSFWPILIGESLYHDNKIFIRELVQNSIDACNLRKLNEKDNSYKPKIKLYYNINKIVVVDNGVGMNLYTIEKYLTRLCISFYSTETKSGNDKLEFYPISKFGIGFLSCLMVSNNISVKTSDGCGKIYDLQIKDVHEYIQIEESEGIFQGTEIIVNLKDTITLSNVITFIRSTFQFIDFEIEYFYPDGSLEIVGRRPFNLCEFSEFGTPIKDIYDEYNVNLEFSNGIIWSLKNKKKSSLDNIILNNGQFLLLMDGIFVGYFPIDIPWFNSKLLEGIINLRKNDRIDITYSRNEIIKNGKYKSFMQNIERTVYKIVKDKLESFQSNRHKIRDFFKENITSVKPYSSLVSLIKQFFYFEFTINRKLVLISYHELKSKIGFSDVNTHYYFERASKEIDRAFFSIITSKKIIDIGDITIDETDDFIDL